MPFFEKNIKSWLHRPFALAACGGFIFVALLTIAGGWFSTQLMWQTTVRAEAHRQALRVRRAIFRESRIEEAFIDPASPAAAAVFQKLKAKEFFREEEGVVAVHIWDRKGRLAWSSREQMMEKGLVKKIPAGVRRGEIAYSFNALGHELLGAGAKAPSFLEAIVPLWWRPRTPDASPDLYIEIYANPDFLIKDFRDHKARIWILSIALGAAGYLFLLGLIWLLNRQWMRGARQEERLAVSRRIAAATASILEPEELFQKIVQEVRKLIPCDRCLVGTYDYAASRFNVWHVESDVVVGGVSSQLRVEQGNLLGGIYEKNDPFLDIPDLQKSPLARAQELAATGLRSLLAVPVLRGGETIAHIGVSSTRAGAFSEEHRDLLLSIAGQIGPALRNAALFHTAETRARRLETLHSLTQTITENMEISELLDRVAEAAAKLLDAEHARIFMMDDWREYLILKACYGGDPPPLTPEMRISLGQSITGWALQEMRPKIVVDAVNDPRWERVSWEWAPDEEFRAFLVHPISYPGGVLGSINVMSRKPGYFTREDLTLLGTFAGHAAIAIHNARLHEEAKKQIAKLESLQKSAQALTTELQLSDLLKRIDEESAKLLGANGSVFITRDSGSEDVQFVYSRGISKSHQTRMYENFDQTLSAQVLKTKRPDYISDTRSDPRYPFSSRIPQVEGFRSLLVSPLMDKGEAFGVLNFFWEDRRLFSQGDIALAQAFADQAAVAIQNARLHEEMRRNRDFLHSVVGDTSDPVVISDADQKVIFWNTGAEQLYGYAPEEVLGQHVEFVVTERERESVYKYGRHVRQTGETAVFDVHTLTKDGREIPVSVTLSPVKQEDGSVMAVSAIHKDMTERIESERALRMSEERFRKFIEFAADALFVHKGDGKFVDVNQKACDSLGYTREELLSFSIFDIEMKAGTEERMERWGKMLPGDTVTFEGIHQRKDGTTFPVEVHLGTFELGDERYFLALARDISARKRDEEALRLAKEEAEAANRAKSDFLSNVSHELRTPLTSVVGFSEILMMNPKNEKGERLISLIHQSGKHLTRLIDDLLDFDRIEAGKVRLTLDEVSINELVGGAIDSRRPSLPEGLLIETELDPDCGAVTCDPTRINQVISNLLDNAVKFSPDGGAIRIRTRQRAGEILVSVEDEGIGIASGEIEKVFDRFRQLQLGHRRSGEGLGLGLSIVRALLRMHGGRIWLESKLGCGSTFTFTLPKKMAAEDGGASPAGSRKDDALVPRLFEPWADVSVLVVDDTEITHEYMQALLKSASKIYSAYNGEEALKMVRAERPDLILMDLRMPVMDGFEAIEKLKADPLTADIPIIAVTAQAVEEDRARVFSAGAEGFVTKPVNISLFRDTMENVFASKRQKAYGKKGKS